MDNTSTASREFHSSVGGGVVESESKRWLNYARASSRESWWRSTEVAKRG